MRKITINSPTHNPLEAFPEATRIRISEEGDTGPSFSQMSYNPTDRRVYISTFNQVGITEEDFLIMTEVMKKELFRS